MLVVDERLPWVHLSGFLAVLAVFGRNQLTVAYSGDFE